MNNQIEEIRTILLSAKYGHERHPEILECFPNGPKRTIRLVEVTLRDGTKMALSTFYSNAIQHYLLKDY